MQPETLFKSLADPTRLRCLLLLVEAGELCVCELTHALGLAQPKVSHHLATLRRSGLVEDRRVGLWVYYRLTESLEPWVIKLLQTTAAGLAAKPEFAANRQALIEMPNRPGGARSA